MVALDQISLVVGGVAQGPIAVVSPGTRVELHFRFRLYNTFPRNTYRTQLFLEGPTRRMIFCFSYWNPVLFTTFRTEPFTAPMSPGRYAIRWSQYLPSSSDCRVIPDSLVLRTIAELIVR
jgi:hypothetical protein